MLKGVFRCNIDFEAKKWLKLILRRKNDKNRLWVKYVVSSNFESKKCWEWILRRKNDKNWFWDEKNDKNGFWDEKMIKIDYE